MIGARHQRGLVANPGERSDQREQVSAIHVIPRGALVLSADKELGTCCAHCDARNMQSLTFPGPNGKRRRSYNLGKDRR
jgi:hypothetical protein